MKREEQVIIGLCLTMLFLFAVRMYVGTLHVTDGITIASLEESAHQLRDHNMQLEAKILHVESFSYITQQAKKQGYVQAKGILSL